MLIPLKVVLFVVIGVRGLHLNLVEACSSSSKKSGVPTPSESSTCNNISPSKSSWFLRSSTHGSHCALTIFSVSRWCDRYVKYQCNPDSGIPYSGLTTFST